VWLSAAWIGLDSYPVIQAQCRRGSGRFRLKTLVWRPAARPNQRTGGTPPLSLLLLFTQSGQTSMGMEGILRHSQATISSAVSSALLA
jgi:hypothetical protein